jgi:hypothetical protein
MQGVKGIGSCPNAFLKNPSNLLTKMMQDIKEGFTDILTLFGLTDRRAFDALDRFISLVPSINRERCRERCI